MAIILRFVDCHGIIRERFFDVVGVRDTTTLTLKENITSILTRYDLQNENIRGQGYDGASNIRGAWNGLQALFLNECPYAYYVHCFAHRLQLALVAASKNVHDVWLFFSKLNSVVNFVNVSPKRHSELKSAREDEIIDREHGIYIPDMDAHYLEGTGRSCQQQNVITVEQHYHVDIFNVVLDFQLMELGSRFPDQTLELLCLSSSLDPTNHFESFNIDDMCNLAQRFYPLYFTEKELGTLKRQLQHFKYDVLVHSKFQNLSSLSELCQSLIETKKSEIFFLIDRLIRLVLTLPVSIATTECAFSAMKLVKTSLRNKMDDDFLSSCMVIYIERELMV
ncbi:hypothetical protein PTKIN_Ptkin16aG0066300 [Pterospermum kingtungense]